MKSVFILCALVASLYLVSCCEKETHYLKGDECCKKCGPGKRMLPNDDCKDPGCKDCEDGEYQSGYTSEGRCERQPSCDINLNFQSQTDLSKTKQMKCQCKPGYYCTQADDCNTCREHTVCKPGQRVVKKGSPESDTVCEACKNGTFSTHESADACKEWTICEYRYDKNSPGSSTSDRICLEDANNRIAVGVIIAVVVFVILISILFVYKHTKCNEKWKEISKKTQNINPIRITMLDDDTDAERAQPIQQPEEDEDNSMPVSPTLSNMTENGYPVQQEHGKESVSSHPESNSIL